MQPRVWKALERHPLNKERDWSAGMRAVVVEETRRIGIVGDRKIILHQGMVLDGWQFLGVCAELDTKPTFAPVPEGIDPEDYISITNLRRHETEDGVTAKVKARRVRVAESRVNGESLRTIAEKEGVSKTTVMNDMEAFSASTGQGGCPVEPANGEVVGKDKKKRKVKPKKPKPPTSEPSDADESVVIDAFKKAVPESLRIVFQQTADFRSIMHAVAKLKAHCEESGKHPAWIKVNHQEVERMLRQVHAELRFAMPYTECPKCRRKANAKCPHCRGRNWLNESDYKACASNDDKAWTEGRS